MSVGVAIAAAAPALVQAQPAPSASATPLVTAAPWLELTVETRGAKLEPLEDLRRQGIWVIRLVNHPELLVPASLRYRTVKAAALLEGVAAYRGLAVSWWQGRKLIAILHRPAEAAHLQSLLADLTSTDEQRRREGAWRAGWERDARLIPALVALANETGRESSRLARRTLGRFGWEAALALREADTLRLLHRVFDPVRFHLERVTEALTRAGSPEAMALLRKLVDAGDVNAQAVVGQVRTAPTMATVEAELAKGNRLRAMVALGELAGPEAFALVDQAVRDTHMEHHEDAHPTLEAVRSLGRVAGRTPAVRARALATLEATFDKHAWVYDELLKVRVIEALVDIGPEALPLLMKIIQTKSVMHRSGGYWPVESAIVKALGELGGPGTWELVLASGGHPEVATAYLAALALSGREALTQVLALLRSNVRVGLDSAMSLFECSQAVRILQAFAESDSDYYARDLRQTLAMIGGNIPVEKLRTMASDANPYLRSEVPELLLRLSGKTTPDLVLELAASLAVDPYWPVRDAATRVLARLPEERAIPLLGKLTNDEHPNVRISAYRELALVGGEQARRILQAKARAPVHLPHEQQALASELLILDMDNVAAALKEAYLGETGIVHYLMEASRQGWQAAKAQMVFPELLRLMGESLDDSDSTIAVRAVRFLASRSSHPGVRAILGRLYRSPSYVHAKLGRLALVAMGTERGVDFLKYLLPTLEAEDRQAIVSLVRWRDDLLGPMLERALAIEPASLIRAVETDDLASARTLLAQGADVNAWRNVRGETVLMAAAARGSLSLVRLLVESQANIHRAEQSTGMTALAYAVNRGRRDVAAYLLRRGANANVTVRPRGEPECSLLALSLRRKDPAMARLLAAHGARE